MTNDRKQPPKTPPKPSAQPGGEARARMSLANVREEAAPSPLRDVYYGADGVGKTSFAAEAPDPIFLPGPDWPRRLRAKRFPQPSCWQDVFGAIDELRTQKHDRKTLVLDNIDAIERLIWRDVAAKHNVSDIEQVGGGFQKGYIASVAWWGLLLAKLAELQAMRGMHVILLAHARKETFKHPLGEDYMRWVLNIDGRAADLVRAWADNVLFLMFERRVTKASKHARAKGQGGQLRLVQTTWHAAYDAKNRANLPPTMDMDFPAYFRDVMEGVDIAGVLAEIEEGIARLEARPAAFGKTTLHEAARALLKAAGQDPAKIHKLANWVAAKLEGLEDVADEEEQAPNLSPESAAPAETPAATEEPALTDAEVAALPETAEEIADLIHEDGPVDADEASEPEPVDPTPDVLPPEEPPAPPTPAPTPKPAARPPVKVGKAAPAK